MLALGLVAAATAAAAPHVCRAPIARFQCQARECLPWICAASHAASADFLAGVALPKQPASALHALLHASRDQLHGWEGLDDRAGLALSWH